MAVSESPKNAKCVWNAEKQYVGTNVRQVSADPLLGGGSMSASPPHHAKVSTAVIDEVDHVLFDEVGGKLQLSKDLPFGENLKSIAELVASVLGEVGKQVQEINSHH